MIARNTRADRVLYETDGTLPRIRLVFLVKTSCVLFEEYSFRIITHLLTGNFDAEAISRHYYYYFRVR